MSERIRVGVIGTSPYTDLMHLPNLDSHPGAQLAAICGRNQARALEMANKYDIAAVYDDYRDMLDRAQLDAVVVAAPDDMHYPMTMAALDAGYHILCEKPLATNAKEALAMAEKAEASGVKHMAFFTWRWIPHYSYLHQLIEEGYIGAPYLCQISYTAGYGRKESYSWRFDAQRSKGILADLGSHMIDMAQWLVGDIMAVNAKLQTWGKRINLDGQPLSSANDSASLALAFSNGAHCSINVSAMAHVGDHVQHQQLQIFGEKGSLALDLTFRDACIRGIRYDQTQWQALPVPDSLLTGVDPALPILDQFMARFQLHSIGDRLFIDSILADQSITPNFRDGLRAQMVIDAAFESHRHGCWITLPAM